MNRDHGRACTEGDWCDYCQNLAEDRAYDWGDPGDIWLAEAQYERHMDRMGGAA